MNCTFRLYGAPALQTESGRRLRPLPRPASDRSGRPASKSCVRQGTLGTWTLSRDSLCEISLYAIAHLTRRGQNHNISARSGNLSQDHTCNSLVLIFPSSPPHTLTGPSCSETLTLPSCTTANKGKVPCRCVHYEWLVEYSRWCISTLSQ